MALSKPIIDAGCFIIYLSVSQYTGSYVRYVIMPPTTASKPQQKAYNLINAFQISLLQWMKYRVIPDTVADQNTMYPNRQRNCNPFIRI